MAFLRCDDASGTQHPLVGTRVSVGRAPTNDVVLERDMSVSRHHAVFEHHEGQWTVRDEQSANGTFVNGDRTLSWSLRDRDRITVGNTTFVFVDGDDPLETEPLRTVFGERVLVTLLFTDIVSSTEQASRLGDRQWKNLLDRHDRFAREQVQRFQGWYIKQTGDGILASFDDPYRALQCACAIRDGVRVLGIDVRSGLHTGEIEMRGDDVAGMAVHIAARIANLAGPGQVLVSDSIPPLVSGAGLAFAARGEHELKGVSGTWRISSVEV
jgi:class 3 adenylate cyclase